MKNPSKDQGRDQIEKWADNKFGKPDKTGKRKSFGFRVNSGGKG